MKDAPKRVVDIAIEIEQDVSLYKASKFIGIYILAFSFIVYYCQFFISSYFLYLVLMQQ